MSSVAIKYPKVLVAVASKHGGTQDIAYGIARILMGWGIVADVRNIETDGEVDGYEAVILGSAVYRGSWLKSARQFVNKHAAELATRPTWLFSSGPIGKPLKPQFDEAVQIGEIIAKTKAREHHVFTGKLDKRNLNLAERSIIKAIGLEEGDWRDWNDVGTWAVKIAKELRKRASIGQD